MAGIDDDLDGSIILGIASVAALAIALTVVVERVGRIHHDQSARNGAAAVPPGAVVVMVAVKGRSVCRRPASPRGTSTFTVTGVLESSVKLIEVFENVADRRRIVIQRR